MGTAGKKKEDEQYAPGNLIQWCRSWCIKKWTTLNQNWNLGISINSIHLYIFSAKACNLGSEESLVYLSPELKLFILLQVVHIVIMPPNDIMMTSLTNSLMTSFKHHWWHHLNTTGDITSLLMTSLMISPMTSLLMTSYILGCPHLTTYSVANDEQFEVERSRNGTNPITTTARVKCFLPHHSCSSFTVMRAWLEFWRVRLIPLPFISRPCLSAACPQLGWWRWTLGAYHLWNQPWSDRIPLERRGRRGGRGGRDTGGYQ